MIGSTLSNVLTGGNSSGDMLKSLVSIFPEQSITTLLSSRLNDNSPSGNSVRMDDIGGG